MRVFLTIIFLVIKFTLFSQSSQSIQTLYILLGDWEVTTYEIGTSGKWEPGSRSISRIESILSGKFLNERCIYRLKAGNKVFERQYSFDPRRGQFKINTLWQDDGFMDTYIGKMINGVLDVNNLSDASKKNIYGIPVNYQMTLDVKNQDELRMNINESVDGGNTWKGVYMIIYKRL